MINVKGVKNMHIEVDRVKANRGSLYFTCTHAIAPVGEDVFAVQGVDRLLYTSIDSDVGKEFAVRVIKKKAWNVRRVKVRRINKKVAYTIPKKFVDVLGIKKGDLILILVNDNYFETVPLKHIINKIGKFQEPLL